jgi:hypothetical protein
MVLPIGLDDYSMRVFCERQQVAGYQELSGPEPAQPISAFNVASA